MSRRENDIKFLTKPELKALLERAKRERLRNYCMILLAYRHGLRASEVVNITIENLDLDAGNIRCVRGKGSITNWQAMANDEIKAVRAWLRKRPKTDSRYLFVSAQGKRIGRVQFYKLFSALAEKAKIPPGKRHPHVLKHSLGTHLANAGCPPQVIQQRLGHRNIQNTMVYLSISSAYVDRAFEAALANGAVV